jgi:hypothetical protein
LLCTTSGEAKAAHGSEPRDLLPGPSKLLQIPFDRGQSSVYECLATMSSKRVLWLLPLLGVVTASAQTKVENWLEVRSPHFIVVTNGNEKQGRHIADLFERMRSVFHTRFPKMQVDPGSPIVVIALKDEKDFRALEPEAYLGKGQLNLAGLFLRAPDKNYILLRLDASGEHPYATVYHEYTHLLTSKADERLPLWLNEGLAEFYENTDIGDKDVLLGEPSSEMILFLRQNRLIPLATLIAVDRSSPYYHEENKGSIFYAESWVLTHYLTIKDRLDNSNKLGDYAALLRQKTDPVVAATSTFGDEVLRQDPSNVLAHEALKSYGQAVKLDSQSFLAHYYFASISMNRSPNGEGEVESSLRSAIKLNPSFAPSYDRLAVFYAMHNRNLAEAHMLSVEAVDLDPGNIGYRVNAANVLLAAQQEKNAIAVLQQALKVAKSPQEVMLVQNAMDAVQRSQEVREQNEDADRRFQQEMQQAASEKHATTDVSESQSTKAAGAAQLSDGSPKGPRHSVSGTIKNVRCTQPAIMDIEVDPGGGRTVVLHALLQNSVQRRQLCPKWRTAPMLRSGRCARASGIC